MKPLSMSLIAVFFAITCTGDERADWKEFTCKEGGFQVLMPGTPKQADADTESDFGPGVLHMNTVNLRTTYYGAHYGDFPEGVKKLPLKQVYDSSRDGAAGNMRGKVASEKEIKLGDHPGREIQIDVKGGELRFRARVFLVGTRLYQVVAFGPKEAITSKEADKFFESFKLTSP
jgi:hypothetical protein